MWTLLESPVGPLRVVALDGAVTAVDFVELPTGPGESRSVSGAAARADGMPLGERRDDDPLLTRTVAELAAYFARDLKEFTVPVRPAGTEFQQRVWEQLRGIGYGEVVTYGEIARRLQMTGHAARAVGLANGRNPIPVIIPCHRVVGADGSLTGYGGGMARKQQLLELEQDALF